MLYDPKPNTPSLTVVLLSGASPLDASGKLCLRNCPPEYHAPTTPCAGVPELRAVDTMYALDHHLKACRDCCVGGLGTRLRLQCLHPEIASGPSAPPFPFVTLSTRVGPSRLRPAELEGEERLEVAGEPLPVGQSSRPLGEGSLFGAGPMGEESADLAAIRAALERLVAATSSGDDDSVPSEGDDAAPSQQSANPSAAADPLLESRPQPARPSEPPPPPPSPEELLSMALSWFEVHFSRVAKAVAGRQRRRIVASGESEEIYAAVWAEAATLYEARRGRACPPNQPPIVSPPASASSTAGTGDAASAGASLAAVGDVPGNEGGARADGGEAAVPPLSSLLVLPPRAGVAAEKDDALAFRTLLSSLTLGLAMLGLADSVHLSAFHPLDTFQMQTLDDGSRVWRTTLAVPIMHVVASAATEPSTAQ
jgi:hypothetical protein